MTSPSPGRDAGGGPPAAPDAAVPMVRVEPPYGPAVVSLRLRRSIVVRAAPDESSSPIGTIAQDTRVAWRGASTGPGCPRWIQLAPRGWVCEKYLEPTTKKVAGVELPKLKADEIVPGVYGKVATSGAKAWRSAADIAKGRPWRAIEGSVTVRFAEEEVVGGKAYWRTTAGELILASKIHVQEPSRFVGVRLGEGEAPRLPLAWAKARKSPKAQVVLQSGTGAVVGKLAPKTMRQVHEWSADGKRARVGDDEWARAADLHVARAAVPPEGVGAEERWFDVDLDEQVLVAYEGARAVYATLVSTGSKKFPTPPGTYRIWIKFAETDMNGQMAGDEPYSVATVPWTMFFAADLALHAAYWHDRFGEARSHGCINLAPLDARMLYFWSAPEVPLGWSMAYATDRRPGSLLRIGPAAEPGD